jgi:two-component system, chemotaxis family, sensor kinase CheA
MDNNQKRFVEAKMQVSDGLISITLHAFDKVRDLLKEKGTAKIANAEELKDHLKIAIEFLKSTETESMKVTQASVQPISKKDELATFFFRISPTVNVSIDGNHPLVFINQDLEALGTAKTSYYRISNEELDRGDHVNKMTVNEETLSVFSLQQKFIGENNKNGRISKDIA